MEKVARKIFFAVLAIGATLGVAIPVGVVAQGVDSLRAVGSSGGVVVGEVVVDGVVVTGTRTPRRLADSPVLTTVIGSRAIERSAAVSAIETLQDNIPGMVTAPNEMGNNLTIKGLNSRYVLMLVDGERLVGEGANGNVNLDQVDVGSIERIEIVDGAASALWGSNAVGGVINIITKEPAGGFEAGAGQSFESPGTWRTRVDAGFTGGWRAGDARAGDARAGGMWAGGVRAGEKQGEKAAKFSARGGAFRNSSDGFGGEGTVPYAARYEDRGANLRLRYEPTANSDVNVTGRWFRHETFNRPLSMDTAHPLTDNITLGIDGGVRTGGVTGHKNKNSLRLSATLDKYFDRDVLEKRDDKRRLENTATWLALRAVDTFNPSEKWEIVGGAEWNREQNWAKTTLGATPRTKSVDEGAVFAQGSWRPMKSLDVILGARHTQNTQFGGAFTPKLSLMYSVGGWRLRGGIGTAFRAPSIKELYYDFDHQGMFWIYGNPDLVPEKGLHTSLSAQYTGGAFDISLGGYHNRIDDKIVRYDVLSDAGTLDKHYKNVSRAVLRGVDLNAAWTLWRELALRGSYSFCDATDLSTGRQLDGSTRHSATVSATWNGSWGSSSGDRGAFSLQLAGRVSSPFTYLTETVGTVRSGAWSVWKLVLTKPFTFGGGHSMELSLKVDNLLDFKDIAFVNPGRQFLIGVNYKFNKR